MLCEGRVALVTGGSRGLGRSICKVLAREGARIAFTYATNDADADATLAFLREAGARVSAHKVSVLDKPGLNALVKQLDGEHGKLDVLVNNAGFGQVVPLALMEESDWDQMLDTVQRADIRTNRVHVTELRQRNARLVQLVLLARTDHDTGARVEQAAGDHGSDTSTAAGHHGGLARK